MHDELKKVLIVGLGLLGGSYAEGLKKVGYEVGAIDINDNSIKYALDKKIIDHGMSNICEEYIKEFDLIIFALYPKVLIEWLKANQRYIKKNAILTDVTGVKGWLIEELETFIREDIEFIGAHPMAGREVYGVENSNATIFKGANYIITPTKKSTKRAIDVAKKIGEVLEFKHIVVLSPEEHDEMIGFLSQLTHCIAISLMTCKESEHLVEYTGDSFRDLTRIAKINENMWSELFLLNKEELLTQMNLFIKEFNKLKEYIEEEYIEEMKDMMRLSTTRRKYFDK